MNYKYRLMLLCCALYLLLFAESAIAQEDRGSDAARGDTVNVAGKLAFDVLAGVGYRLPKINAGPGAFINPAEAISYTLRATYPLKKFRLGLAVSMKQYLAEQEYKYYSNNYGGSRWAHINGLQSVYVTADYYFLSTNRFSLGGYSDILFYINKRADGLGKDSFGEDHFRLGIFSEYGITENLSFLSNLLWGSVINRRYGKDRPFTFEHRASLNVGIRFSPSVYNSALSEKSAKKRFAIAVGWQMNAIREYNNNPKYNSAINEYEYDTKNMYKAAFNTIPTSPVINFSMISSKMITHSIGIGFFHYNDTISMNGYDAHDLTGWIINQYKAKTNSYSFYYQATFAIFKNRANDFERSSVFPYMGGKLVLNYKEMQFDWNEGYRYPQFGITYYDNRYSDFVHNWTLLTPQFIVGVQSHKNNIFFDTGIACNIAAYITGKYDYSSFRISYNTSSDPNYDRSDYPGLKDDNYIKWLSPVSLITDKLLIDDVYFKIGYSF